MTIPDLRLIHEDIRNFAYEAINDGMTVYVPTNPDRTVQGDPIPVKFFHYSRDVDGRTCYGTVSLDYFGFASVTMPRRPDTVWGSALVIADNEDANTINSRERPPRVNLAAMRQAASPENRAWFDHGDRRRRGLGESLSANHKPSGVPDRFRPANLLEEG